jgi:hypothetical protein
MRTLPLTDLRRSSASTRRPSLTGGSFRTSQFDPAHLVLRTPKPTAGCATCLREKGRGSFD